MSRFSCVVFLLVMVLLATILEDSEAKPSRRKKGLKACKCKLHPNGSLSCRKGNAAKFATIIKCLCKRTFHHSELTDNLRRTLQKHCGLSKPL